jgi:hypothetical protein
MGKQLWALLLFCGLCCGGAACGYTDPGHGTGDLLVDVDLSYAPHVGDHTAVQSRIQPSPAGTADAWGVVSAAGSAAVPPVPFVVELTDADSQQAFHLDQSIGDVSGYHRRLKVKITAGAAHLECRLEGPGRHTLRAPLQGQAWKVGDDLLVQWQTTDGVRADEVDLKLLLANYTVTLTQDRGHYTIPAVALTPGNETLTVVRRTRLHPSGGSGASQIRMQYEVAVNFQVTAPR